MKKGTFHIIFIAVTAVILLLVNQFGNAESYMAFSLIPILIAFYIGQFAERKFRKPVKN